MLDFGTITVGKRPIIIAHRGAGHRPGLSSTIRENTLEAFASAVSAEAEAIECDLRRTSDGVIVVHHNRRLQNSGVPIADMTFARMGRLSEKRGFHLPTLAETLRAGRAKTAFDLELKESGYEEAVLAEVGLWYDPAHILFTSFNGRSIRRLKELSGDCRTGLLLGLSSYSIGKGLRARSVIRNVRTYGADFAVVHWRLLTRRYCQKLAEAGLPVIAWTVNRPRTAARLIRQNISGIITDYPERLIPLARPVV